MLGMENGYMPKNSASFFEAEWYFGTNEDSKDLQEAANFSKWLEKLENRFSDGRTHVAGDHLTYADFALLS